MKTLAEIGAEVVRLSKRTAAPGNAYPTFGYSADFARSYIEIGSGRYHYVAVERDMEVFYESTSDLDGLPYWMFDGVAFSMIYAYELEHRIPRQDFRQLVFGKRVELLTSIDSNMRRRGKEQTAETLRNAPFNDDRA